MKDKTIAIENAGSIAEASLKLNEVFEAAQAAADAYLDNIKNMQVKSSNEENSLSSHQPLHFELSHLTGSKILDSSIDLL